MANEVSKSHIFPPDRLAEVTKLGMTWQMTALWILRDVMGVHADLSNALFYDLALHLKEDVDRQAAISTDGIRPAKFAAYLAFWMRKIKPISRAYYVDVCKKHDWAPPPQEEINDINEKVAVRMAFNYLWAFHDLGHLTIHLGDDDVPIKRDAEGFKTEVASFCHQKLGVDGECVLETLIYDMRYRTFGPHHLVHLFDQFVFRLYARCEDRRAKGLAHEDAPAPA